MSRRPIYDVPSKSERDDGGDNEIGCFGALAAVTIYICFVIVLANALWDVIFG